MRTFQARLSSRLNHLTQKLSDNAIKWMGVTSDVIRLTVKRDNLLDPISRTVTGVDVIEIMFPNLIDIPMWRFTDNGVSRISNAVQDATESTFEPFICYAPIDSKVDQDDLLVKFFDNPAGDEPMVIVLQVKDVLGTFGQRSIIYMKLKVTYADGPLPPAIVNATLEMARRRADLKW